MLICAGIDATVQGGKRMAGQLLLPLGEYSRGPPRAH